MCAVRKRKEHGKVVVRWRQSRRRCHRYRTVRNPCYKKGLLRNPRDREFLRCQNPSAKMSRHEAEAGGTEESREPFTGRPLPLNSKRLTGAVLKQLARRLEVPASASASPAETHQLIKDKLSEMGRGRRRKEKLRGIVAEPEILDSRQKQSLYNFLTEHHQAFYLDEHE